MLKEVKSCRVRAYACHIVGAIPTRQGLTNHR